VNEVLPEIILWYRYNFEKCESCYSVDLSLVPKVFLGIIVLVSLNFLLRELLECWPGTGGYGRLVVF